MPCFIIEREIPDADVVREHARQGEFSANRISQVLSVVSPTTAES